MRRLGSALSISALATIGLVQGAGHGQEIPIGDKEAPGDNAAGAGNSTVSPRGKLRLSVPLKLPAARGGVPVPLSVSYDGGHDVGAAGLGWNVPLSYVTRSRVISGR